MSLEIINIAAPVSADGARSARGARAADAGPSFGSVLADRNAAHGKGDHAPAANAAESPLKGQAKPGAEEAPAANAGDIALKGHAKRGVEALADIATRDAKRHLDPAPHAQQAKTGVVSTASAGRTETLDEARAPDPSNDSLIALGLPWGQTQQTNPPIEGLERAPRPASGEMRGRTSERGTANIRDPRLIAVEPREAKSTDAADLAATQVAPARPGAANPADEGLDPRRVSDGPLPGRLPGNPGLNDGEAHRVDGRAPRTEPSADDQRQAIAARIAQAVTSEDIQRPANDARRAVDAAVNATLTDDSKQLQAADRRLNLRSAAPSHPAANASARADALAGVDTLAADPRGAGFEAATLARGFERFAVRLGESRRGIEAANADSGTDFSSVIAGTSGPTQPGGLAMAPGTPAMAPPAFTAQINAPMGSEAWQQAVNQQALRLSHLGDGSAELTLNPRDLGPLHISLKMGEQAQLQFVSAHADVRAAVEAALPQLRQAFADNGIALGQASVNDQNTGNASGGSDSRNAARGGQPLEGIDEGPGGPVELTLTPQGRTLAGGIDIFA